MKKLFYIFIILFAVNLYSNDSCTQAENFAKIIEGKDILNYDVNSDMKRFFWGNKSNEKLGDFIVYLSWEWNKLDVDSPIVKKVKIVSCKKDELFLHTKMYLYFKYVLFLYKKIEIDIRWKKIGDNWYIMPPDLSENPLK